jgi:hypothetical protein
MRFLLVPLGGILAGAVALAYLVVGALALYLVDDWTRGRLFARLGLAPATTAPWGAVIFWPVILVAWALYEATGGDRRSTP